MNSSEEKITALESEVRELQNEITKLKEFFNLILYLAHGLKHLGNMESL